VFSRLLAGSGLADCSAGRGWHPTWPTLFPPAAIQIDHCLNSAGLAIDVVRTGPRVGSDHYPLVIEGRVLPPPRAGLNAGLRRSTGHR
jgi:endonuclease/exonuclease/phosphatase family metal-dependent hydrolase